MAGDSFEAVDLEGHVLEHGHLALVVEAEIAASQLDPMYDNDASFSTTLNQAALAGFEEHSRRRSSTGGQARTSLGVELAAELAVAAAVEMHSNTQNTPDLANSGNGSSSGGSVGSGGVYSGVNATTTSATTTAAAAAAATTTKSGGTATSAVGVSATSNNSTVPAPTAGSSAPPTCARCAQDILDEDTVMTASLTGQSFHSRCFNCSECSKILAGGRYYAYQDQIMCGRCEASKFSLRCHGCDELIFNTPYLEAMGSYFHTGHFACWECDADLQNEGAVKGPSGHPLCTACYGQKYAHACGHCQGLILPGQPALEIMSKRFHKTPQCFACADCLAPRTGQGDCIIHSNDGKLRCPRCHKML